MARSCKIMMNFPTAQPFLARFLAHEMIVSDIDYLIIM